MSVALRRGSLANLHIISQSTKKSLQSKTKPLFVAFFLRASMSILAIPALPSVKRQQILGLNADSLQEIDVLLARLLAT